MASPEPDFTIQEDIDFFEHSFEIIERDGLEILIEEANTSEYFGNFTTQHNSPETSSITQQSSGSAEEERHRNNSADNHIPLIPAIPLHSEKIFPSGCRPSFSEEQLDEYLEFPDECAFKQPVGLRVQNATGCFDIKPSGDYSIRESATNLTAENDWDIILYNGGFLYVLRENPHKISSQDLIAYEYSCVGDLKQNSRDLSYPVERSNKSSETRKSSPSRPISSKLSKALVEVEEVTDGESCYFMPCASCNHEGPSDFQSSNKAPVSTLSSNHVVLDAVLDAASVLKCCLENKCKNLSSVATIALCVTRCLSRYFQGNPCLQELKVVLLNLECKTQQIITYIRRLRGLLKTEVSNKYTEFTCEEILVLVRVLIPKLIKLRTKFMNGNVTC